MLREHCPDRPVGRLLEPRAPALPETDPYCDFCGRTTCRGDCWEKRLCSMGFAAGLAVIAAPPKDAPADCEDEPWWNDPVVPLVDGEES